MSKKAEEPVRPAVDDETGLPVLSLGLRVTSSDVAALIDDDA